MSNLRILINKELYDLYRSPSFVRIANSIIIRCAGHVDRRENPLENT
jgi:hypothetical protein